MAKEHIFGPINATDPSDPVREELNLAVVIGHHPVSGRFSIGIHDPTDPTSQIYLLPHHRSFKVGQHTGAAIQNIVDDFLKKKSALKN